MKEVNLLQSAIHYHSLGLSVLPLGAKKDAIGLWGEKQKKLIHPNEQDGFKSDKIVGIGVIAGKVSGSLEVIDIDCKYDLTGTMYQDYVNLILGMDLQLFDKLVIQKTQNNGYHFIYKCDEIEGNTKLANRYVTEEEKLKNPKEKVKTLIETRGEGGYIMCYPSAGYELVQGSFDNINIITKDERFTLLNCAKSFNQIVEEVKDAHNKQINQQKGFDGLSPFEDFNLRGDIIEYLVKAGWTEKGKNGKNIMLLRPGGEGKWSATYHEEKRIFYVFSTSTEFENGRGFNNSQVLAILNFNKDFSKTSKYLFSIGFGERTKKTYTKPENKGQKLQPFWYVESKGKEGQEKYTLKIDNLLFVKFLQDSGFHKIYMDKSTMYVKVVDNIADEVTNDTIRDFVKNYIRSLPDVIAENCSFYAFSKEDLEQVILKANHYYLSDSTLTWIDSTTLYLKRDTKHEAFYYFKNCWIKVMKDDFILYNYSELKTPIWRKQIIDREFHQTEQIDIAQGDFCRFLKNVCNNDDARFLSMTASMGYILHGYKDASNAKMIVFMDESIGSSAEANGGTGKSLVTEALRRFKSVCYKGVGWTPEKSFAFEGVSLDTSILLIDDAIEKFPFGSLFTHITGDFNLEGKGDKSMSIPFDLSPKIILTTNFTLKGEGNSFQRRKHVNEFFGYYDSVRTPISEFGHRLFDDWDSKQWQAFDNFMIYCVMHFLENGLNEIVVTHDERELIGSTGEFFVEFMDDIQINEKTLMSEIQRKLIEIEPTCKPWLTSRKLSSWIKKYVKNRGIGTKGSESKNKYAPFTRDGGHYYIEITKR